MIRILDHVYALMRTSMALINPSRFKGWSTTVEEAKSFGVPLILSDIDVHREQTDGTARYFGIDDPDAGRSPFKCFSSRRRTDCSPRFIT